MLHLADLLPPDAATPDESCHRQRLFPRYALDAEVELLEPVRATGVLLNASLGGLRIAVDVEIAVGARCVVLAHTERGEALESGTVVWRHVHRDGCVLGLRFAAE